MEKLIEYFKDNHEGKNWTLFLIILGVVHSVWWFNCESAFIKKFGTQNPYFIFLEILFIASGITRFLIVIDIFYILAHFCLVDDLLKLLWKKRRDEWRSFQLIDDEIQHDIAGKFILTLQYRDILQTLLESIMHSKESFHDRLGRAINATQIDCDEDDKLDYFSIVHAELIPLIDRRNAMLNIRYMEYTVHIPYHVQYWIKKQGKKSFLDKTIIVGKKIGKYILSHVQKH